MRSILGARMAYFLREAAINIVRSRTVNALTIGIICASLFILGGFILLVSNLHTAVAEWNRVAINVYLTDGASFDDVAALRSALLGEEVVASVRYVSKEQAAGLFKRRFAHLAQAADDLGSDLFPASLELIARGGRGERLEETERVISALRASPLVEEVRDTEEEARKVLSLVGIIAAGGWVVGGILAVASFFTIFNVIRLTVFQRSDEISIMRLVGATGSFIRAPFLVEGTLQGALGAVAAEILLFAAYGRVSAHAAATANPFLQLLTAEFLTPGQAALLALAGTLLGTMGSLLSVRRFLSDRE